MFWKCIRKNNNNVCGIVVCANEAVLFALSANNTAILYLSFVIYLSLIPLCLIYRTEQGKMTFFAKHTTFLKPECI